MKTKIIGLALSGITLCVVLLLADNIESAYAITLISNEPFERTFAMSAVYSTYISSRDYLVSGANVAGVITLQFTTGSSLTAVQEVTIPSITTHLAVRQESIKCDSSFCYVMGQAGTNPAIAKVNLDTFAVTTYSNSTWIGCQPGNYELSATTVWFTMEDTGGCPFTGVYTANKGFTATGNWFTPIVAQATFGVNGGSTCLIGNNFMKTISDILYKFNIGTHVLTSVDTGASAVIAMSCDSSFAYVSSNLGNYVKRVLISSMTLQSDTGTVTAPTQIMVRGDSVYVARGSATTVTAFNKSNLTNSFVFLTLANNDLSFYLGNSTRFNILSPFANNNLFYAVSGVLAPELEPSPTPSTGGIDCTLPENENILVCRLGGTGAFGSAGDFIIGVAPTNTTEGTGLTGIGCAIGLVDCVADPDIKTNGLGLLIFIASIFIVVGMFVTTQGLGNTIKLPLYMWAMIIIALSAFFTLTNVIDPVFLIISIIGLIALGAPRIVNVFKGGDTMGEGSTA